ncbi:MAG: YCF48-related protein [FCB group bacterium]|jgi:photosystem II stability/assembly factor-like uncharacterized protein
MKYIYLSAIYILLISIIFCTEGYSQWKEVTTIPPPYNSGYYLEVTFLPSDPNYGWCCGFDGYVIRTTDGGKTWAGTTIFEGLQLESINFVDKLNGYTSGDGRIYKTIDGGITWQDVSPVDYSTMLWGNYFVTPDFGMVIGGGCYDEQHFYRTTDGGNSWDLFTAYIPNSGLTDIVLYSEDGLGYATSSGKLWRTLDGGKSWSVFSVSGIEDWQEEITHIGNTFLVPYSQGCSGDTSLPYGGMRMTTNNGTSWREYSTNHPMFGAFLLDEKRGWACGIKRAIYYTSDGGVTWELRNCGIPPERSLDDIWFINDTLGWVVGQGVFYTHKNDTLNPNITAIGDTTFCEGDSVKLTALSNYNYYLWSTGETTKSITVRKPGTYSVTVANSECDSSLSNLINVSFYTKPNPKINASKTSICEGDSALLSVSPSFPFYIWSTGDTTNFITVYKDGNYTVTVTDTNGCTNSYTIPIHVTPNPQPVINIIGNETICTGDTIILEISDIYKKYFWYNDSTSTLIDSTSNKIIITQSGRYSAVVINEFGCIGTAKEVVINVLSDSNRIRVQFVPNSSGVFSFDSTYIFALNCRQMMITNVGPSSVTIEDILIYKNIAFSLPQNQFPLIIPAGESRDVMVCYSPTALAVENDTLLLPDHCSPHIIPLVGIGEANIYDANSNCGVLVQLTTTDLQNYLFNISPPVPNPANSVLSVPFNIKQPVNGTLDINENCILYNSLGEQVATSILNIIDRNQTGDQLRIKAEFDFDLNNLQSGFYIVVIKVNNFSKSFPVVIYK